MINIVVRTSLIAGFPGESDEEFADLMQFVADMKIEHLGVFAFSRESGTPADKMEPQIKKNVIKSRRDKLMLLQSKIAEADGNSMVGQTLTVMVDGNVGEENGKLIYSGRSQRDAYETDGAVFFLSEVELISGELILLKIIGASGYDLIGQVQNG